MREKLGLLGCLAALGVLLLACALIGLVIVLAPYIARSGDVRELIIAVNATVEGQTTAHYITDQLSGLDVKITRLAHGVPVGGELDYLDEGTLTAALRARTAI